MSDVLDLARDAKHAQKTYEEAFKAAYPDGTPVMWVRGGNRMHGVIMHYAYGERVKVYNYGTRKEYFIYFSDILRAIEGNS